MNYIGPEENSRRRFASGVVDYLVIFVFFCVYVYAFDHPNAEDGRTVTGLPAVV
jgi:hypothetical protein